MGLIRKAASLSTLGAVKYTSRREAETKAASAEARLANEQARTAKASRKADQQAAAQEQAERASPGTGSQLSAQPSGRPGTRTRATRTVRT
jgi:hypothetical protein